MFCPSRWFSLVVRCFSLVVRWFTLVSTKGGAHLFLEGGRWQKSNESFSKFTSSSPSKLYLITGFIASRYDGISTNLGRNGSDYSAAIFASLFDAEELVIWTDVDGVLSADPNRVKNARLISNLSYNEAMELAYFGAKVIHPKTFSPLIKQEIPIFIRNTFDPEKKGTKISSNIYYMNIVN